MTPESKTIVEAATTTVEVNENKVCNRCIGRCKMGGIYRCQSQPITLGPGQKKYFEPCEQANPNNNCKKFKQKSKTVKGVSVQGEQDD